jgi:hypothetical protein
MENLPSLTNIITILVIVVALFLLFRIFKMIFTVLTIIAFLIIGYITNPSKEEHLLAVHDKAERKEVRIPDGMVEVEDFKVLSFTKIGRGNEKEIVGVGAFTKVWIFGDLRKIE